MSVEIKFALLEIHMSPWEAHVSRAFLESEGIPVTLASEHHIGAIWPMSLMLGGVRVLVPAGSLASARELLALRDKGVMQEALLEQWPSEAPVCSKCGAATFVDTKDWASIALSFLLLFICKAAFPPAKVRRCTSCGQPAHG
jgi:hypothetical protein